MATTSSSTTIAEGLSITWTANFASLNSAPRYLTLLLVCLGLSLPAPSTSSGQQLIQRLRPQTPAAGANFGWKVAVGADQIFVHQSGVAKDSSLFESGILVYTDTGSRWVQSQIVTVAAPEDRQFISGFVVAGDQMFVQAEHLKQYVRDGDTWEEAGAIEPDGPQWYKPIDMNQDYLLVEGNPSDYRDRTHSAIVFRRDGLEWTATASGLQYDELMCLSGRDVIGLKFRETKETLNGPSSAYIRPTMYISTEVDSSWVVTDSLTLSVVPGRNPHLSCSTDGSTIAVTLSDAAYIVNRTDGGRLGVDRSIPLRGNALRAMDALITEDNYYVSYESPIETELSPGETLLRSRIDVYSRDDEDWKYVTAITPVPNPGNPLERNDGCIGASLAANEDYLIAGAPVRSAVVDGSELDYVGEVYVLSHADIDPRLATQLPKSPVGWSGVYPNPGRGAMTVNYTLPVDADVTADVFDLLGRRIASLESGLQPEGSHALRFDTSSWSRGVYVLRLTANRRTPAVQKFVVR